MIFFLSMGSMLGSRELMFFGATFLATIAVLPLLIQLIFRTSSIGSIPLLISGASIIIISASMLLLFLIYQRIESKILSS